MIPSTITIPTNLLIDLLDSGSDDGCEDCVVVDKLPFIELCKLIKSELDLNCGNVTEDT